MTVVSKRNTKRVLLLGAATLSMLAFQNCSRGFEAANPTVEVALPSRSAETENPPVVVTPAEPAIPEKTVAAAETQPVTVHVSTSTPLTPASLPAGALYDAGTQTLRWLPKIGQYGLYTLDFKSAEGRVRLRLKLQIAPGEADKGPADGAQDGDVGFVFIHGMGAYDRCADAADLAAYWNGGPAAIARDSATRTVACYDGRRSVESVALFMATQILGADCGRFNRCILVTHSMGGLIAEFIMTHARPARADDPEPALFTNHEVFALAKQRTLSVVSFASAAGGSKVADVLQSGSSNTIADAVASIARWMGSATDSTRSLVVARATGVLAPLGADPGVPVYMVPSYSQETAWQWDPWTGGVYGSLVGGIPLRVFQGDSYLTKLDGVIQSAARSDGLVDFRSSCGLASSLVDGGPGYGSTLDEQLAYCAASPKKPNHVLWFATEMNHFTAPTDWPACNNAEAPCRTRDLSSGTLVPNASFDGVSGVRVARAKMDANRSPAVFADIRP